MEVRLLRLDKLVKQFHNHRPGWVSSAERFFPKVIIVKVVKETHSDLIENAQSVPKALQNY
jgi:hypothetical protein